MLRQGVDRSTEIRIYAPDKELQKVAGYLADLLARDQYKSVPARSWDECDFSLAFVPADPSRPEAGLYAILNLLGPESTAVSELAPSIVEVWTQTRAIGTMTDSLQRQQASLSAEQVLVNDLGCYPLFRPRIYFVRHKEVRGTIFDADGEIDPAGLMRVRPLHRGNGQ